MNLIILFDEDFITDQQVRLTGRRRDHILSVQRAEVGETLSVGRLNGKIGKGLVIRCDQTAVEMTVELTDDAPQALPLTLLLALPRPKMLKRILQTIATMGVKRLILINSYRVEKSYWQTPILQPENIQHQLLLGLEQAKDTRLPEVLLKKRFKPFVEDELADLVADSRALVAHPHTESPCPLQVEEPITLAIGPEGGFIQYEVDKLLATGFEGVHLGKRILKVETAIPVLLAKLF